MIGSAFIPISVLKSYTNRYKGIKHRKNTKKHWYVYGYNVDEIEEEINFTSYRVNPLKALWYKKNLYKIKYYYCNECEKELPYFSNHWYDKIKECGICESNDLDKY